MRPAVFAGSAAHGASENMRKMGGGNKAHGFSDLRYALICMHQQFPGFCAAEPVVVMQRRYAGVMPEGSKKIASVDVQRAGHLIQGKLFRAVRFHVSLGSLYQAGRAALFSPQIGRPFHRAAVDD